MILKYKEFKDNVYTNSIDDIIIDYKKRYDIELIFENDINKKISELRKKTTELRTKLIEEKNDKKKQIIRYTMKIYYYKSLIFNIRKTL